MKPFGGVFTKANHNSRYDIFVFYLLFVALRLDQAVVQLVLSFDPTLLVVPPPLEEQSLQHHYQPMSSTLCTPGPARVATAFINHLY